MASARGVQQARAGGGRGGARGAAAPPDLQGAPYQWVPGTYNIWIDSEWFQRASDHEVVDGKQLSPMRVRELLGVLREKGMLSWATPERIAKAAEQLHVNGGTGSVWLLRLNTTAFDVLGLPPGTSALVGKRSDRGLDVVVSITGVEAEEGQAFALSAPHKLQIIGAVEAFTQLRMRPEARQMLLDAPIRATLGAGTSSIDFKATYCHDVFGKAAYDAWFDSPTTGASTLQFGTGSGSESTGDLTAEEVGYVRDWLTANLQRTTKDGRPVVMSRLLLETLRKVDAVAEERRARIVAMLQRTDTGAAGQLTPAVLERVMQQAAFDEERERAGFEPTKGGAKERPPVFDMPIPARIDQRSGLILSGESVTFTIAIDWPTAHTAEQQSEQTWRTMTASVDWLVERPLPSGPRQERTQTTIGYKADGHHEHRFALEPGEHEATWTVHAFVHHNFFQPKHVVTQVQVKTEAKRLEEMRAQSFAQLGQPGVANADHDFDTSTFNEWFGDRAYDHGVLFRGDLPADFQRRTPAQRKESLDLEIRQNEQLLAYLRRDSTHPDAIAASEHYIAKLRDAQASIDGDVVEGWQPFEIRGFFLGKGNRVADGPLDLHGTVRRTSMPMPGGQRVEMVEVAIRDLSRRLDAENYRFSGAADRFDLALEHAFVDLCKKYPGGKVSVLAEGFDPGGRRPTGKTIGYELDTGTEWEDVKGKVFDPVINVAVNIASAVTMIVFPASIPVLLPVTIAYNQTQNIDQLVDEIDSGTLTGTKAALHLGQFALDVLPMVGRAPIIRGSRSAFAMFEVGNFAGQAILMKAQVQDTILHIRDTQIASMGELYARYVELERTTQASDPNLAKLRAELDRRGQEIRDAAIEAWEDAALQFAIVAVPTHVAQAINVHVTTGKVATLQEAGLLVHAEKVEPHYDRRRGQIVGDRAKLDQPQLERLAREQEAHLRDLGGHLASELGVATERVIVKPAADGDGNRLWRDGDAIQVRYQLGTDPAAAFATWMSAARDAHLGAPSSARGETPATFEPAPAPTRPRVHADATTLAPHVVDGGATQAKETTAAAVPGSSFRGGTLAADASGVLTDARAVFETAARRFGEVTSVERASTKHLDPGRQADERARLDDTYLLSMADGPSFTIRVTTGPVSRDAVARTIINPTKQGATLVDRPGEAHPTKVEVQGRYVIQLNETMDRSHAERAIAHEVGEILAERELAAAKRAPGQDLLRQGSVAEAGAALSPHDRGRVGELKVLAHEVNGGDATAVREMLALVEELGVRDGMPGAPERQRLLREALANDPAALAAFERTRGDAATLDPDARAQLDAVRAARAVDLVEAERRRASIVPVHDTPDAAPEPGKRITLERAKELADTAAVARARQSHATVQRLRAEAVALPEGEYPRIADVQVGGGAGLAARDRQALLVDGRGRWQVDASARIAQTANQLRGLKDAGIGDPFQFAEPNERVPMSALRYWEDSIAAQGPVIDGHVTGVAVDDRGRTIMTIQPGEGGPPLKVQVDGNVMMSSGFPAERIPGTPRGQMPDKAIDDIKRALGELLAAEPARAAEAQKVLHEIEHLSGLELAPGQREKDLAAARASLRKHGLEEAIKSKAQGAHDMMVAGDRWNDLRQRHPDKFVLGDMANLQSLDVNVTDKWIIGGPGGTGISAAEIVLAKNSKAHVTMVGYEPPPGLIENDQFLEVLRRHADAPTAALYERIGGIKIAPGDGRFSLVLGIDVQPPTVDAAGGVQARGKGLAPDFVPDGYTADRNPMKGGAYISSIGRESQLPPIAAAFKDSIEAQGGTVSMQLKFQGSSDIYLGYELIARDKAGRELRRMDVTGAASRFPPWEFMLGDEAIVGVAKDRFKRASDLDAPPESGNFDGGFVASATQAARYARHVQTATTSHSSTKP